MQSLLDTGMQEPDASRSVAWMREFILFHDKRHPNEMGMPEINGFLGSQTFRGPGGRARRAELSARGLAAEGDVPVWRGKHVPSGGGENGTWIETLNEISPRSNERQRTEDFMRVAWSRGGNGHAQGRPFGMLAGRCGLWCLSPRTDGVQMLHHFIRRTRVHPVENSRRPVTVTLGRFADRHQLGIVRKISVGSLRRFG